MNVSRTGLIRRIDLGASAARFRLCQAGVDAEFLDRIRIRENSDLSIDRLIVVHAIQRKVVVSGTQSIGGNPRAARAAEPSRTGLTLGVGHPIAPRAAIASFQTREHRHLSPY